MDEKEISWRNPIAWKAGRGLGRTWWPWKEPWHCQHKQLGLSKFVPEVEHSIPSRVLPAPGNAPNQGPVGAFSVSGGFPHIHPWVTRPLPVSMCELLEEGSWWVPGDRLYIHAQLSTSMCVSRFMDVCPH